MRAIFGLGGRPRWTMCELPAAPPSAPDKPGSRIGIPTLETALVRSAELSVERSPARSPERCATMPRIRSLVQFELIAPEDGPVCHQELNDGLRPDRWLRRDEQDDVPVGTVLEEHHPL